MFVTQAPQLIAIVRRPMRRVHHFDQGLPKHPTRHVHDAITIILLF
jgi:hypothetical protein